MSELNSIRLRELLIYDPSTGVFTWRITQGRMGAGKEAGTDDHGYVKIIISRRKYAAHRLAWLYTHNELPTGDIDHINGIRNDNRIENLRDVSRSVNLQNMRKPKGSNPYLGVTWDKSKNRWLAAITINRRRINLGRFKLPDEAHAAYLEAKRKLHEGCTI